MKEAVGEVNMTVVTIVAIAVIGGILALMWPSIQSSITSAWGNTGREQCTSAGCAWDDASGSCNCGAVQ